MNKEVGISGFFRPPSQGSLQEHHATATSLVGGATHSSVATRNRDRGEWAQAYNTNPILRSVVSKIAYGVASLKWGLVRTLSAPGGSTSMRIDIQVGAQAYRTKVLAAMQEEGTAEPIFEHPFLDLLDNPCPLFTGLQVRNMLSQYYEIHGEFFLLVIRDTNDNPFKGFFGQALPRALYPIPPHAITRTPSVERPTFDIKLEAFNMPDVSMADILWHRNPDIWNPYGRGSGMIRAAADEIDSDENAAKMIAYSFYNRGRPELLVSLPKAQAPDLQKFALEWQAATKGVQNALSTHFVNVEAKVDQLGYNFEHLQVLELRKYAAEVVRMLPGVPIEMLGGTGASSRAAAEAAEYIFGKHVVMPRAEDLRAFYQKHLVPEFDPRAVLDYSTPLQEDKNFALNVMRTRPEAFEVDEVRKMAGQPAWGGTEGKLRIVAPTAKAVKSLEELVAAAGPLQGQPGALGGGIAVPGATAALPGGAAVDGANGPGAGDKLPPGRQGHENPTNIGQAQPGHTDPGRPGASIGIAVPGLKAVHRKIAVSPLVDFRGSPDEADILASWKTRGFPCHWDLAVQRAPFPLSDHVPTETLRRALAFSRDESTAPWDRLLGPWGKSDEQTVDKLLGVAPWTKAAAPAAHSYATSQVDLPAGLAARVRELGRELIPDADVFDDDDGDHGREDRPHVTVKYGLLEFDPVGVKRAVAKLADRPAVGKLGATTLFSPEGKPYDVVKLDVESIDLHRLNGAIAAACECVNTQASYEPHVTLAYVKRGSGSRFVGNSSLAGEPLSFSRLIVIGQDGEEASIPLSPKGGGRRKGFDEGAHPRADDGKFAEAPGGGAPISDGGKEGEAPSLLSQLAAASEAGDWDKANALHDEIKRQQRERRGDKPKKPKTPKPAATGAAPKTATDWKAHSENLMPKNATEEEGKALLAYKEFGFIHANEVLRTGKSDKTGERIVAGMDSLFEKSPGLHADATVYRGVRGTFAEKLAKLKVGSRFSDKGFVSSSLKKTAAKKFAGTKGTLVSIRLPKGTRALPGTNFESELILGRGQRFKVVEKTPKGIVLEIAA